MLLDAVPSLSVSQLATLSELERRGAPTSPQSWIGLFLLRHKGLSFVWSKKIVDGAKPILCSCLCFLCNLPNIFPLHKGRLSGEQKPCGLFQDTIAGQAGTEFQVKFKSLGSTAN